MEDPMNAALLSQRYTGKKKKTKGICQPEPKTPTTLPQEERLMSVEKMCPAILMEEGVREERDSLENGSKVNSDVMCPGKRGVRVPRYPVVILALVVQHGAASAENA